MAADTAIALKPTPMMDFVALTKPRITWLILMSTGIGFFFGLEDRTGTGAWNWAELLIFVYTVIGTALIASGTAALNQWFEREADGKMRRTEGRRSREKTHPARRSPVRDRSCRHRFRGARALVNLLSGLLGLFTLSAYLFVYTPLKQRTSLSTLSGAARSGAATDRLRRRQRTSQPAGWSLFAICSLAVPHFLAIAWMYREDYPGPASSCFPSSSPMAIPSRRLWPTPRL